MTYDPFLNTLEKLALGAPLPALGSLASKAKGALMSNTAGYLSGLGTKVAPMALGGYQAAKGYNEAKEQGAGTGTAVLQGAMGGLSGAMQGMMIGTVGGAALGGALKNNKTLQGLAAGNQNVTNSGLRQIHGLTGFVPERAGMNRNQALQSIGIGKNVQLAREAEADLMRQMKEPGADQAALQKQLQGATRRRQNMEASHNFFGEGDGLTSIPGYVKGFLTRPGATLTTGAKEMFSNSGGGAARYLPLAGVGLSALSLPGQLSEAGQNGNPGTGEVLGRFATNTGLGLIGAGIPGAAGMAMAPINDKLTGVGGMLGRGIDKAREYVSYPDPRTLP